MQLCLLDRGRPRLDASAAMGRIELGAGAWLDWAPGWLQGHQALFSRLSATTRWRTERRKMYERTVDVPRMLASIPRDGEGDPLLARVAECLSGRYGVALRSITMALYRDGRDSVAWHGDRVLRDRPQGLVAVLSLGEPRPFLIRPKPGGASRSFTCGWGDLLVMGGSCQRTFEHCVPKVRHAGPRMSVMFRQRLE